MTDNQNDKQNKKTQQWTRWRPLNWAVSTLTWSQLAESAPFGRPGSPGPWHSMGWYLSARHWMATHTRSSSTVTTYARLHGHKRPQCCLSEMAGGAPSQQGFVQQVLFGPLILSERWVIGSKWIICFGGRRKSSGVYINCICKETKARREEMQLRPSPALFKLQLFLSIVWSGCDLYSCELIKTYTVISRLLVSHWQPRTYVKLSTLHYR